MTKVLPAVLALLSLVPLSTPSAPNPGDGDTQVTKRLEDSIVQAIQDEIYDYGYQGWGWDAASSHEGDVYTLRVYIEPQMKDFGGVIIYKLMPYGEVLPSYTMETNGLIRLDDNPELGFGAERPDRLTLYQDDDEICRFKHEWLRKSFTIELKPNTERLREAAERQVKRIGYSVRLDPGRRRFPAGRDPRVR